MFPSICVISEWQQWLNLSVNVNIRCNRLTELFLYHIIIRFHHRWHRHLEVIWLIYYRVFSITWCFYFITDDIEIKSQQQPCTGNSVSSSNPHLLVDCRHVFHTITETDAQHNHKLNVTFHSETGGFKTIKVIYLTNKISIYYFNKDLNEC